LSTVTHLLNKLNLDVVNDSILHQFKIAHNFKSIELQIHYRI
jgi:hypothetical protein